MTEPLKTLESQALELSQSERAELARVLLQSLEAVPVAPDSDEYWAEEAERRYRELKTGASEAIPSEVVLAEARARLR
jgi:putative addiction module component (TIGR02574 family)